ncbi:hypothetical protein Hanom_Chr01g00050811 [Helianthus anomalus]
MVEMVPGKRFDRSHELGQHAFGEKLGLYIVVPQQLVVEVSLCIIFKYIRHVTSIIIRLIHHLCLFCKHPLLIHFVILVLLVLSFELDCMTYLG